MPSIANTGFPVLSWPGRLCLPVPSRLASQHRPGLECQRSGAALQNGTAPGLSCVGDSALPAHVAIVVRPPRVSQKMGIFSTRAKRTLRAEKYQNRLRHVARSLCPACAPAFGDSGRGTRSQGSATRRSGFGFFVSA
jgi:hypothetical protein